MKREESEQEGFNQVAVEPWGQPLASTTQSFVGITNRWTFLWAGGDLARAPKWLREHRLASSPHCTPVEGHLCPRNNTKGLEQQEGK